MKAKDRIVEIAFNLFCEKSYKTVTIDTIAQEAGVAKGTVLYHFESKYNLAKEALILGTKIILDEVKDAVLKEINDKKKFYTLIISLLKTYKKYPKINRFTLELYELPDERKKVHKLISQFYDSTINMFTKFLELNNVPNPKVRAQILRASMDGLIMHQEFFTEIDKEFNIEEIAQELLNLALV